LAQSPRSLASPAAPQAASTKPARSPRPTVRITCRPGPR